MEDSTKVRLAVYSEQRSPEQLSADIGMPYDTAWRKGDRRTRSPKGIAIHKLNAWLLNSELDETASLEKHVQNILNRVAPVVTRLKQVSESESVELSATILASYPPALSFTAEVIAALGAMGASLDLDLYIG